MLYLQDLVIAIFLLQYQKCMPIHSYSFGIIVMLYSFLWVFTFCCNTLKQVNTARLLLPV